MRKNKFTDQTKINVHMNPKIMEGSEIIESWLNENNYSFTKFNEPTEFFHYIVKDVGLAKLIVEIYLKKDNPSITFGSMGIMSGNLLDVYVKLTDDDRENFIKKINELLNDFNTPYQIKHDEKSYVLSIFAHVPFMSLNKNNLVEAIELVKNASEKCLGLGTKILQEYREQYKKSENS